MSSRVSLLLLACLAFTQANAGDVFNDYRSYYLSKEGVIFKESDARSLQQFSITFDDITRKSSNEIAVEKNVFHWEGRVNGGKYSFSLVDKSIYDSENVGPEESFVLNGKKYYFKKAKVFPGEVGELDARRASLFINKAYLCLEGVSFSASGTSQRHVDVYFLSLRTKGPAQHFFKLPSLFASCLGIRRDKTGNIVFPKVSYRNYESVNTAAGVTFQDYTVKAEQFIPIGSEIKADFVESENMYKFKVQ